MEWYNKDTYVVTLGEISASGMTKTMGLIGEMLFLQKIKNH